MKRQATKWRKYLQITHQRASIQNTLKTPKTEQQKTKTKLQTQKTKYNAIGKQAKDMKKYFTEGIYRWQISP